MFSISQLNSALPNKLPNDMNISVINLTFVMHLIWFIITFIASERERQREMVSFKERPESDSDIHRLFMNPVM